MFEYFPVNDVRYLQVSEMKGATGIYISDSPYTRELRHTTGIFVSDSAYTREFMKC